MSLSGRVVNASDMSSRSDIPVLLNSCTKLHVGTSIVQTRCQIGKRASRAIGIKSFIWLTLLTWRTGTIYPSTIWRTHCYLPWPSWCKYSNKFKISTGFVRLDSNRVACELILVYQSEVLHLHQTYLSYIFFGSCYRITLPSLACVAISIKRGYLNSDQYRLACHKLTL